MTAAYMAVINAKAAPQRVLNTITRGGLHASRRANPVLCRRLDEDISVARGDGGSNTPTVIIDNNPTLGPASGFTAEPGTAVVGKHWRVRHKGD